HDEWTKLSKLPSTWWILAATVVLTAAIGAAAASSVTTRLCPAPCHAPNTVNLSLSGIQLSQAICLVLGTLSIGAEYSTGTIRTTLTAMPGRWRVLASKAATLSALTALAGTLSVLAALALARLILPTPPDGDASLRAAGGSILVLVLVTLLGLSLATLLRDTSGAITLGLGVLYVVPLLSQLLNSPTWRHRLQHWGPVPTSLPTDLWPGLGVLAAYAVGLLAAGGAAFRLRDA
ncbi:ABC transporter permease subunit, partial [Streptomyces sp. NPDC127084]|uniref:ABC transporter permease subunit n=1 Tax=Streptomyces sp. NPDC127084 TaxID=3347133 RepID=UPI00364CF493